MRLNEARFSRRQFLGASLGGLAVVGAGAGGGDEGLRILRGAVDVQLAWHRASQPNVDFIASMGDRFDNVTLGTSFAPEQWTEDDLRAAEGPRALEFAVKELGLRVVRLGLRWDRTEESPDATDLSFYRPYLDYCISEGLDVCLNVGPVRVFRWPEDHVPDHVFERTGGVPRPGTRIEVDSDLGAAAFEHLDRLIDRLKTEYSADDLSRVRMLQAENEPFFGVGPRKLTLSPAFVARVIETLDRELPGRRLLVTSAARLNLGDVQRLFVALIARDERLRGRLVSGFDYHFQTPRLKKYPFVRHLDPIAFAFKFPPAKTTAENIRDAREAGYEIEVSEGQAEPNHQLHEPGNSVRAFRFMLARCVESVLDPRAPSVLRIWGVEELAKKALNRRMSDEHRQIVDLIQALARPVDRLDPALARTSA